MATISKRGNETSVSGSIEMTAERIQELLEFHPISEKGYCLPTPMLERTYAIVRERVWTRKTGMYFYGTPRLGKSTCAVEIVDLLRKEFPRIFVSLSTLRRSPRPSDAHMFKLILEGFKHTLSSRKDADLLFKNIVSDVQMNLGKSNGSQFVLVLDEIQLLNDTDFEQLLVLHNVLELEKIRMTTISFGQPEILHKVSALLAKGQTQIIARFLSENLAFEGCSSLDGLKFLLNGYDENSEYPDDSGWTYTRFFLPLAFANGFRLKKYARKIWSALCKAMGAKSDKGVPMEHVCATIEYLLLAGRKLDCASYMLSDEEIEEAVEGSNLRTFSPIVL